jgi:hypothetical protein
MAFLRRFHQTFNSWREVEHPVFTSLVSATITFYRVVVAGSRPDEANFSIYLILPAALGPGVYSGSNRNEYWKQTINNFWGDQCAAGE